MNHPHPHHVHNAAPSVSFTSVLGRHGCIRVSLVRSRSADEFFLENGEPASRTGVGMRRYRAPVPPLQY